MPPHLDRVIHALAQHGCKPRRVGDLQYRAHCPGPSHTRQDKHPSLGIKGTPDRVLVNCFVCGSAGKNTILDTIGLSLNDLFAGPPPQDAARRQRPRKVAVYPYETQTGDLVAQKVRFEPKTFRWHSPDPDNPGRFIPGKAMGVTLYCLPDLIDARVVVIVEGEKAVDRLMAAGIVATCGSTQWTPAYTDAVWRAGACRVVVIPDSDRIGRQHATRVVQACHGYQPSSLRPSAAAIEPWASWPCAEMTDPEVQPLRAAVLELVDLPYHGDICDWFDRGHTADELRSLIARAKDPDTIMREKYERKKELARTRQRRCRARKKRDTGQVDKGVTP